MTEASKQLIEQLDAELGPNASETTDAERIEFHQFQFQLKLRLLENNKAYLLDRDRDRDILALEALEHLAYLLKLGKPTQEELSHAAYILGLDTRQALAAFGLSNIGRSSKARDRMWAIAIYELAKSMDFNDEYAECFAHLIYFRDKSFEKNSEVPRLTRRRNSSLPYRNITEQRLDTVIRPMLRAAGAMEARPVGRTKKSSCG